MMKKDSLHLGVSLAGVELKNPVMTASGTFGSGAEYSEFVDLNQLGAVVTKGVANVPWPGNPTPRIAEVYGGMLNAIGLQNPGMEVFCQRDLPFLKQFDTKVIVNVCGKSTQDYCEVVERLSDEPVDLLEINISCPNVKEGGIAFGQDPKAVEAITREIKKYAKQPVIMKLSPNVTDITEMARAAESGGADIPPVLFARAKVLRLISIFIPVRVLIRERTSAPPLSAAFAISVMSVTLGLSFMMIGCFAYFLTSFVMASRAFGSCPKAIPPSFTFGQDTLISRRSTGSFPRRSTTSQ